MVFFAQGLWVDTFGGNMAGYGRLGSRQASAAALLGAAAAGMLSGCSAQRADRVPDPPFAVFESEAGVQDELPAWVELDTGTHDVRFLTTSGTGSYYVSRDDKGYCLAVVREGPGESYSAFCRGGPVTEGSVLSGTSPGTTLDGRAGMVSLVVDGYMDGAEVAEGWELIHENVLVRLGVPNDGN